MDEVADLENIGEQFRFLLQPVRDLAKNWDIDIKHYLEDYLNKLTEEHDNELDARGKRKIFNFAEAAVVIDGSTNIYCRKVDYLLQQAQDCLIEISVSNEKKKKRRVAAEDGDQEAEGGENGGGEDDEELEDPDEVRRRKNPYLKPITAESDEQMRAQFQKLLKKRPCFPIVPLAFTPLMEFEKTDVVLYHRGGEKKGLEMVGKKDDFKVNTCQVVDGVALIDLKNSELLEMFSNSFHTPTATRDSIATTTAATIVDSVAEDQSQTSIALPPSNPFDDLNIGDNLENIDPNGDDYFDFTNDDLAVEYRNMTGSANSTQPKGDLINSQTQRMSVFFDANAGPAMSLDGLSQNSLQAAADAAAEGVASSMDAGVVRTQSSVGFAGVSCSLEYDRNSAPYNLRQSAAQMHVIDENGDEKAQDEVPPKKSRRELAAALEEPFEPLDPMEVRNGKSKPFQMNKRCVTNVAKQLAQRDRRIEKECREKNIPNISTVKNFIDTRIFGKKIRKKSYVFAPFNSFLMDRALLAVNAEFYAEQERRNAIRKQRNETAKMEHRVARRTSQTSISALAHKNSIARLSNYCDDFAPSPPLNDLVEELGADDVIDYDSAAPDLFDSQDDDRPLGDLLNVEDLGEQSFMAYDDGDEDLNRSRRRSALIRSDNIYDDTIYAGPSICYPDDLPPRPLSQMEYNELVEYHLKKYWTIKEEATTKFAQRVREWENKVTPLLEKESDRDLFNTRMYSTNLIDSFKDGIGGEIDFMQFVKDAVGHTGKDYNLSRYLLVSLILTNMQNVEIVSSDVNSLKLRLTKLERHEEVFDDEQRLITGGE